MSLISYASAVLERFSTADSLARSKGQRKVFQPLLASFAQSPLYDRRTIVAGKRANPTIASV